MQKTIKLTQSADNPKLLELTLYGDVRSGYDWDPETGEVGKHKASAAYVTEQLAKYPDAEQINVYMHSPGGSVYEAMPIWTQLKRHPARVVGYVDGIAFSAMSYIATACDELRMYRSSVQMIHNMGALIFGNAQELRTAADFLDKMMVANRQAYLQKAGDKLTEERLIEMMDAETFLTAQECVDIGLCDVIIDEDKNAEEVQQYVTQHSKITPEQQQRELIAEEVRRQLEAMQHREPDEPAEPEEHKEPEAGIRKGANFLAAIAKGMAEKGTCEK